jgi:hypothetical protein
LPKSISQRIGSMPIADDESSRFTKYPLWDEMQVKP